MQLESLRFQLSKTQAKATSSESALELVEKERDALEREVARVLSGQVMSQGFLKLKDAMLKSKDELV